VNGPGRERQSTLGASGERRSQFIGHPRVAAAGGRGQINAGPGRLDGDDDLAPAGQHLRAEEHEVERQLGGQRRRRETGRQGWPDQDGLPASEPAVP
jgi:hypothetical protein